MYIQSVIPRVEDLVCYYKKQAERSAKPRNSMQVGGSQVKMVSTVADSILRTESLLSKKRKRPQSKQSGGIKAVKTSSSPSRPRKRRGVKKSKSGAGSKPRSKAKPRGKSKQKPKAKPKAKSKRKPKSKKNVKRRDIFGI